MFLVAFAKTAGLDQHQDGAEWKHVDEEPSAPPNPAKPNPSGNQKGKAGLKNIAVGIVLGNYKEAARRDDTAQGVSEGLEKEYNSRTQEQDAEDREAVRDSYTRYRKLKGKKC